MGDDWSTVSREYGDEVVDGRFDRARWPDRLANSSGTLRKGIYIFGAVVLVFSVLIAAHHERRNPLVATVNTAEQSWSPNANAFCRERARVSTLSFFSSHGVNVNVVRSNINDLVSLESAAQSHIELEQVHAVVLGLTQLVSDPTGVTTNGTTSGFFSTHLAYHDGLGYTYLNAARDLTQGIAWASSCH